jgi:carotenoid cleavage dioxygenase-like enzyme
MAHRPHDQPIGALPPAPGEANVTNLEVEGSLPRQLSGRHLSIGSHPIGTPGPADEPTATAGMVHAVTLHAGRATSYRSRWVRTDPTCRRLGLEPVGGPTAAAHDESSANLLEFAGRTYSLSDGSLAYELAANLDTVRRVDLAGRARGVGARPKIDRSSGELHLISSPGDTAALLHVISPGGLTRRTRSIDDPPGAVRDLALTPGHIVLVADGCIGLATRDEGQPTSWHVVDSSSSIRVISAHDDGDTVVVHLTTPALERWTLHRGRPGVGRIVLDATPQGFGRIDDSRSGLPHRYLYSVTDHDAARDPSLPFLGPTLRQHDLRTGTRVDRRIASDHRAGEFLFVADPARSAREDGGWLLGLVHDDLAGDTSLVVLDAADPHSSRLAAVRLPRRLPRGLHGLWSPTSL